MSTSETLRTNRALARLRRTARDKGLEVKVETSKVGRNYISGNSIIKVVRPSYLTGCADWKRYTPVVSAAFRGPGFGKRMLTKAQAAYMLENALWSL